jgi:cytochrome c-type biogenesis protein CcmH
MRRRRFPLWTLLAAVLVVALVVGSGVLSSSPPTPAQRAYAVESILRCPSCEDLSVADSTAPTAVAVRATVRQLVAQGRTDQQIESFLVARYGSTIVLDPPARGWSLLVWLLPLVGGGVAVLALGRFLFRRRVVASAADPGGEVVGPAQLEERRRFLTRSLSDADAEYLAGDLTDRDYLALRHRDLPRLAAVEAQLATTPPARGGGVAGGGAGTVAVASPAISVPARPDGDVASSSGQEAGDRGPAPSTVDGTGEERTPDRVVRSRRGRWLLRGAVVSFAAAVVVAVSLFVSNRLPGQTATGSVSLTQAQQVSERLDQAAALENQGQLGQAAQVYQSVLSGHPDNEVALAQLGWVEYRTGRAGNSASLLDDAQVKLERATALDPGDYAASLYLGTVLLQRDGNAAGAVGQFQRFLADGPPADVLHQAAPELRQAYAQAGVPLPAAVPSS